MASSTFVNLEYGKDYDYIIESMWCEYKLDVDQLRKIVIEYKSTDNIERRRELTKQFHQLYPEYPWEDISNIDPKSDKYDDTLHCIPQTIKKKVYFVQSPKGENGLPSVHYSLKEKMLSDYRAQRKQVKAAQEKANHEGNIIESIRLNAKQLAIKVVCNSEYGASNNENFAHYDPDIAAAVTFAARKLIGFLTTNLECRTLYIDRKFINDNIEQFTWLINCGCLSLSRYDGDDANLFKNRRHTLARIFDSNYNVVERNVIQCNIKKSVVIYQDTDSNYYTNQYVINYFTKSGKDVEAINYDEPVDIDDHINNAKQITFDDNDEQLSSEEDPNKLTCSPVIIDKCMHTMLNHNILLSNFTEAGAQRKPIGLGFEGSFIVCRYLNRKKRYYGIKWSEDGTWIPAVKLPDERAYNELGELINDYNQYWVPKQSVVPREDGAYIYMDDEKLLHSNVNYLDYVKKYNVKCTGIDLTRRDQFRFINYFHVKILQQDLRLMKYANDGNWIVFPKNLAMSSVIDNVIDLFRSVMNQYRLIANFKSTDKPEIAFSLIDFAKTAAYRAGKNNIMTELVNRIKEHIEELKQEYEEFKKRFMTEDFECKMLKSRHEYKRIYVELYGDADGEQTGEGVDGQQSGDVDSDADGQQSSNHRNKLAEFEAIEELYKAEIVKWQNFIPKIGERQSYVIVLDEATQKIRNSCKASVGKVSDRSRMIPELIDELKNTYVLEDGEVHCVRMQASQDSFGVLAGPSEACHTNTNTFALNGLDYDDWINAKAISMLDEEQYLESLCKSISLYIIADVFPDEMQKIDNGFYSVEKASDLVTKCQEKIAKTYVKKYYRIGKDSTKELDLVDKEIDKHKMLGGNAIIVQLFPNIDMRKMSPEVKEVLLSKCEDKIRTMTEIKMYLDAMRRYVKHNAECFKMYSEFEDDPIYQDAKAKNDTDIIVNSYKHICEERNKYISCKTSLDNIRFDIKGKVIYGNDVAPKSKSKKSIKKKVVESDNQ